MTSHASPTDGTTAAVSALRSQFGDRKPPDITRKITACVACRKQKIKCHMPAGGQPPCTRCRKRGLPCTVNKSLQMLLESDVAWKQRMERRLARLEKGMERVGKRLAVDGLLEGEDGNDDERESDDAEAQGGRNADDSVPHGNPRTEHISQPNRIGAQISPEQGEKHTPQNFEIVMDPDAGPAAVPGSVVSPVVLPGQDPQQQKIRSGTPASLDLITRGIVTATQAQAYLDIYQNRLDHFIYRILGNQRRTLAQVRAASPLLLAAICAVGALHLAAPEFERCYQEFVSIAAAQSFSRRGNSADDVRGLCLAAFWLSGISWTCIGTAVRIATEIQLHRSIYPALAGGGGSTADRDGTHYRRTRLFYLVYVCDHHFSVAYGRPPLTGPCDAIHRAGEFLSTPFADEDDARLVSQVQFWQVGTEIYTTFGTDIARPLDARTIAPLRRLALRLDAIRADWTDRFGRNPYVGNYPRKGVGLHAHFAKLYLYSMAFRGVGRPGYKPAEIALDVDELAHAALLAATAILDAVVTDREIQGYLNGLPTYFDVMIAFAVVFVLKVASTKYAACVRADGRELRALVGKLVAVLHDVTADMHRQHLLVSVARGAETLLARCNAEAERIPTATPLPANAHVTMGGGQEQQLATAAMALEENLFDFSTMDWNVNDSSTTAAWEDLFSMSEFDFLPPPSEQPFRSGM